MSNNYSFMLIAFSKESTPLCSFLGYLLTNGWHANLPLANNTTGYLLPDLRIMTRSSSGLTQQYSSNNAQLLPDFASDDCVAEYTAILGDQSYPGFVAPAATDSVAVVMGESLGARPSDWAEAAIDHYYDDGLRFFMVGYSVVDFPDGDSFVFYSAAAGECQEFKMSLHCVGLEQPSPVLSNL